MIIFDDRDWISIITQPDHARFAGELLSLWRLDGLPEHPRREELLMATREHDNGWQEADSAPWTDPELQRPYDFIGYPESARLELWNRGVFRFADEEPLVALLIAEHAEAIHQPLNESWQKFFDELDSHRQTWLERSGVDRAVIRRDYRFLELADTLSLAVCRRRDRSLRQHGVEAEVKGDLLMLEPFPLAGTTTFKIPIRRIENRPYDSDTLVGVALARARWESWHVKVGPKSRIGT